MRLRYPSIKRNALVSLAGMLLLSGCSSTQNAGEGFQSILSEAASNTVIGMGTVFAVLIFLTWIISLFRFIPKLQEKMLRKKASENTSAPRKSSPAAAAAKAAAKAEREAAREARNISQLQNRVQPAVSPSEEELQVVLAAAVAAYEADRRAEQQTNQKNVQKKPTGPALQNGIRIQSYKRQGSKGGRR